MMDIFAEYYELLNSLPYSEYCKWVDDCRGISEKYYEMKRLYRKEE